MRAIQIFLLTFALSFIQDRAFAQAGSNPEREFIMSCTYGVLAGTLVGAASLAFVDKPGDNLQRVARGASLGLYVGIGLGFYTVYILPKQLQKEDERLLENETSEYSSNHKNRKFQNWFVFPLVGEKGVDGVGGFWQIAQF